MRKYFLTIALISFSACTFSQAANSVLSSGSWFKVGVTAEGVYKLTYSDLQTLGLNVASIDPRNIRIYGNGGGMLPAQNAEPRPLDLVECAIKVKGEADSSFDASDYVLFYGQSQHRWHYDSTDQQFHHVINIYSDTTFYFLNISPFPGARIPYQPFSVLSATDTVTSFDDYAFHELDQVNFLTSGKEWYGEQFDSVNLHKSFSFSFPNHDLNVPLEVNVNTIGRSFTSVSDWMISSPSNNFNFNTAITSQSVTSDFAKEGNGSLIFNSPSDTFSISIDFSSGDPSAKGWLNWIEVSCRRHLTATPQPMFFRDLNSIGNGKVAYFFIANATNDSVWDVTDHNNVRQVAALNGASSFRVTSSYLHEYVVFQESNLPSPVLLGPVANQNLRGLPQAQLIIITHKDFLPAANTLANHHRNFDGLSVNVVPVDQVYNEFSSGSQDITAIRDFLRLFYFRYSLADSLRYVLLFGDASYDYKNRLQPNSDFVPCYESASSLNQTTSFSSDDYFTFMDSIEGDRFFFNDLPDIGIGRLPAKTLAEANVGVNKVIHYATASDLDSWRKEITVSADDEDNNTHLTQAEFLCNDLDTSYCGFDVDKVYVDAFTQVSTPDGPRYPDATALFSKKMDEGALYIHYIGHSGINNWGDENFVDSSFLDTVQNLNHMPFIMAFGEKFNSYDEPYFISGGKQLMLNPAGGAIACLSGSGPCFSGSNFTLEQKIMHHLLKPELRLGDIVKKSFNEYTDRYVRNIVLLGDPALRLNYPVNNVVLTLFNGAPPTGIVDTLPLGSTVSASGEIQNSTGQLLNGFNGLLKILLLREQMDTTLANDVLSLAQSFTVWHDTLYNGTAVVTNGTFSFSFNIPTSPSQYYSNAKFSFYAEDGSTDANGCYRDMVIGNIFFGVDEIDGSSEMITSPNPVTGELTVSVSASIKGPLTLNLFDPQGKVLQTLTQISSSRFTINCSDLACGIYFIELHSESPAVIGRKKIIKM